MKKFFKRLLWSVLILVLVLIGVGIYMHESLPESFGKDEAEKLSLKVEEAINKAAWDSTRYVSWTFADMHDYVWDKKKHLVKTSVGNYEVLFHTQTLKGVVHNEKEIKLFGDQADEVIQKAWKNFANDSFWLIAPFKLHDTSTERSLCLIEKDTCLMVTYTSGGVTPGDTYVWQLDENYRPIGWKLWVKIIPIGGVGFKWKEWVETETGAYISTLKVGLLNIAITNLKTGMSIKEIAPDGKDPFAALL